MALTKNINYLQPNNFKLVIDHRTLGNLEYFAQGIQHPGANAQSAEVPYSRLSQMPFAADKLTFGELSATIMIDEDMRAYTEMYDWMVRLVESPLPQEADVTVHILSSKNNTTKKIRYIDALPTVLGDINLEATTTDGQYLTFPVSFRFSYFEIV